MPAAVAFHRQVLGAFQETDDPPTVYDLAGSWHATVKGLRPASLNGRWTLTFEPLTNRPGNGGIYYRFRNGKLVANGGFGLQYATIGTLLSFHDGGGPGECTERMLSAIYFVRIEHRTLELRPFDGEAQDICRARLRVFANRPFHR